MNHEPDGQSPWWADLGPAPNLVDTDMPADQEITAAALRLVDGTAIDLVNSPRIDDPELRRELAAKHSDVVTHIIATDGYEAGTSGESSWQRTLATGKQQPVSIVDVGFPEGIVPIVFKQDMHGYAAVYGKYASVRRYYPALYATGQDQRQRSILALEKIEGYEAKHQGIQFVEELARPGRFDQLCTEFFEMADTLLQEPLTLTDIRPTEGHNLMFNTTTQHFQLMDTDTVRESQDSYAAKLLRLLDMSLSPVNETEQTFVFRMLQMYRTKYSEQPLTYDNAQRTFSYYEQVTDPDSLDGTEIMPGDERYRDIYLKYNFVDIYGRPDDAPLPPELPYRQVTRTGNDRFTMPDDLLSAVDADDLASFRQLVTERRGFLVDKEFVDNVQTDV